MPARPALLTAALGLVAGCAMSGASGPTIRASEGGSTSTTVVEVTVPTSAPTTSVTRSTAPSTTSQPYPTVTDNRVYLVGDSITESIASRYSGAVCDALEPLGWNVTVDAYQGRHTAEAAQSLRAHRSGVGQVVVVLIGHNDAVDPESYRTQIQRLVGLVPNARRVILLTNYEFERGRDRMNDVLREIASADGQGGATDRIQLVDWNAAVEAVDGAIRGDGLHLTTTGQEALATTIAQALGPAPRSTAGQARKLVCTTLRANASKSGSGSGGSGGGGSGRTTTTIQTGETEPPASEPPATDAPADTSATTAPPTTGKGKPPPTTSGTTPPAPPPSPPGT